MTIQTVQVPHLGGITAAYQLAAPYDSQKPTLVLVHSFMTTSDLYRPQFASAELTSKANLVAVDLLGHGQTRTESENFTYWDSAHMILQVLDHLKVDKFYALGTSQGGFVVARIALLAPSRVHGLVLCGTSMDSESQRTQDIGCWNVAPIANALVDGWTSATPTPDFVLDDGYLNLLVDLGIGKDCDQGLRQFWVEETRRCYTGDDGRRRARMSAINLRDRDGLHGRLFDVTCPVLWLHGTADQVYSVANAEEEIKLFVRSPDAKVQVVQGGQHFLNASNPEELNQAVDIASPLPHELGQRLILLLDRNSGSARNPMV